MRTTEYADELATGVSGDARVERLLVHGTGDVEIRFSWWKNGNIATRPLDVTEEHLLDLMRSGILAGVFTGPFMKQLEQMLKTHLNGGNI
ncbi:hypothetical protein [Methylobacterium bullatum]|uniref:Uncharacterized protein n=1 Tax=Methylobacterium bullatum TaxID=570505 RepID=A0A679KJH4_9HYPH|nr:hypothetical protein MBLL_04736 [Methylobacterium bullatum]